MVEHGVVQREQVEFGFAENCEPIKKKKKKISTMDYYSYRLMVRKNSQQWIHRADRLTQQYVCDMYSKIQGERLNYIRFNQNDFRISAKQGLQDAVTAGEAISESIGRKIILPSSFTNGPRHIFQLFNDAMAIAIELGIRLFFKFISTIIINYIYDDRKAGPFYHVYL